MAVRGANQVLGARFTGIIERLIGWVRTREEAFGEQESSTTRYRATSTGRLSFSIYSQMTKLLYFSENKKKSNLTLIFIKFCFIMSYYATLHHFEE